MIVPYLVTLGTWKYIRTSLERSGVSMSLVNYPLTTSGKFISTVQGACASVRKRRVFWQMDCLLGLTSLGNARVGSRPFVTQVGGILLPPNKVAKAKPVKGHIFNVVINFIGLANINNLKRKRSVFHLTFALNPMTRLRIRHNHRILT